MATNTLTNGTKQQDVRAGSAGPAQRAYDNATLQDAMQGKVDAIALSYTASTDPTANDDSADTSGNGVFAAQSFWLNTSNDKLWVCQDPTTASAVWTEVVVADASGDITGQLIQLNDTAANLASVVPAEGQFAYATDTKKTVIGDGSTTFASLGATATIVQGADHTYDIRAVLSDDSVTPDARGTRSVDLQLARSLASRVASGNASALVGGAENSAAGEYAGVFAGAGNAATGSRSFCAGGTGNTNLGYESVMIGGVNNDISAITASDSGIIGGNSNELSANASLSVIAGGQSNTISTQTNFIGGGFANNITGQYSVIVGGFYNTVSGISSVVCGGGAFLNGSEVSGDYSATIGGAGNNVTGDYSFATGRRAKGTADGTCTLADSTDADFTNATQDQFAARYAGGFLLEGAVRSGTTTLSATGPTDDLDVSQVNTVFVDASSNAVTLGGLVGGKAGQELRIVITGINAGNAVTVEHNEGTANQNIFLSTAADESRTNQYGGWLLVCDGTNWYAGTH